MVPTNNKMICPAFHGSVFKTIWAAGWSKLSSKQAIEEVVILLDNVNIKLLESPIPAPPPPPAAAPSQKASSGDISGTKRDTIDPLVSKRPEKNSE